MDEVRNQSIDLKSLSESLRTATSVHSLQRPGGGWVRAIRQGLGLSLKTVAEELKLSPQAIHQVEKSEARGSISLKQLDAVAGAMGCRLVYALVPREGTLADLAANPPVPRRRALVHTDPAVLEGDSKWTSSSD